MNKINHAQKYERPHQKTPPSGKLPSRFEKVLVAKERSKKRWRGFSSTYKPKFRRAFDPTIAESAARGLRPATFFKLCRETKKILRNVVLKRWADDNFPT